MEKAKICKSNYFTWLATPYLEIESSSLSRLLGNEKRNGHFRHFYE